MEDLKFLRKGPLRRNGDSLSSRRRKYLRSKTQPWEMEDGKILISES